jgi:DNA-binding response OmpR family regulator
MAEATRKVVLVVEDDESVRTLVSKALVAKGYLVEQAADGLRASELLGRLSSPPDLLICDVMMPGFDGYSLVKLIKSKPEMRGLPVIFLTAKTSTVDVIQGIKLGARFYVHKPFAIKDLLDKVAKALQR